MIMNHRYFMITILMIILSGCSKQSSGCDLTSADCKLPIGWGKYDVPRFYGNGDILLTEKIIAENGGFDDPMFFPVSINIKINKKLSGDNELSYSDILKNVQRIYAIEKTSEKRDYFEIIEFLEKNGIESNFINLNTDKCSALNKNLQDIHSSSTELYTKSYFEYATWYSLYVNSQCSTANSRAIYIANLAQFDSKMSINEFNKINTLFGAESDDSVQFRGALCRIREEYILYDETNGIYQLEKAGLIKCAKKLVDE